MGMVQDPMLHPVAVILHGNFIIMVFLCSFIQATYRHSYIHPTSSVPLPQTLWIADGAVTLIKYVPLLTILECLITLPTGITVWSRAVLSFPRVGVLKYPAQLCATPLVTLIL